MQANPTDSAATDSTPMKNDWTKPSAMAIPKEGFFKKEDGQYAPIFPKSRACYSFTIIAKIIPGREPVFYEYSKKLEKAVFELTSRWWEF
jgi:hypothetical protein